jgi:hypothetical protein
LNGALPLHVPRVAVYRGHADRSIDLTTVEPTEFWQLCN